MKRHEIPVIVGMLLSTSVAFAEAPAFKCLPAKIQKVQVGHNGKYDVKVGLTNSSFSGFIDRTDAKPTKECLIADVKPGQSAVIWYDKKSYDAAVKGTSMFPGMQCIFIDDGKELGPGDVPPTNGVDGKDVLTKCPNATGYDCDAGSNSERNSKYREVLTKGNQVMQSFYIRPSDNMETAAARQGKWDGREVFCQAFDKKSGSVLFATQFKVGPAAK